MGDISTTAFLIEQVKQGNSEAANELMKNLSPLLARWAKGRLPHYARSLNDTADLVQETLLIGLKKINGFESQYVGSFLVYLRVILANRIKKVISQQKPQSELPESRALEHSLLHDRLNVDTMMVYEQALDKISQDEKEAVIMRVEFGFNFQEIADLLGKPSANAARMYVSRCLLKLAEQMS